MRELYRGALPPGDALSLSSHVGYREFSEPLISGLIDLIVGAAPVTLEDPSYCRVEARSEGHPWHRDTGTKGHMSWCRLSARILLTPPSSFTGGGLYFRDRQEEPLFHYGDLLIYDDDPSNEHCVARSRGDRRVLIMFFATRGD